MSAQHPPNSVRLQQTLDSCSHSIANGDFKQSEEFISEIVSFLDSISNSISSETNDEHELENSAFQVLTQIYNYLILHSLDQAVADALAFELLKAVAKLACKSSRCFENVERIIDRFVKTCSPRDMVSILCEAMTSSSDGFNNSSYFTPLLGALAKAFEALVRRIFEQIKAATPVVLKVLEATLSDPEDEDIGSVNLVNKAILIAHSLKAICIKIIAILLGCVKEEMHKQYLQKIPRLNGVKKSENSIFQHSSPFWTATVLDFVEVVLKPPKGRPPSLPDSTDAVLSVLNLYRFVLITESSGNTNYTEVLSKNNLRKAYREWFEPLRALVSGVAAESHKENNQLAFDTVCALNPVEFVLYRCIELVEEKLKHCT